MSLELIFNIIQPLLVLCYGHNAMSSGDHWMWCLSAAHFVRYNDDIIKLWIFDTTSAPSSVHDLLYDQPMITTTLPPTRQVMHSSCCTPFSEYKSITRDFSLIPHSDYNSNPNDYH